MIARTLTDNEIFKNSWNVVYFCNNNNNLFVVCSYIKSQLVDVFSFTKHFVLILVLCICLPCNI